MGQTTIQRLAAAAAALVMVAAAGAANAQAKPAAGAAPRAAGLTPEQEADLSHTHDGFYGALAPQNLNKPRPKAPVDFTGTWFINLRRSFRDFMFGPPYPEFGPEGQKALKEAAEAAAAGRPYRDAIGEGWPAGMPMITTRVWPINIIQLPTAIFITYAFTNSYRVIYLDGRDFTDPDIVSYTYNGESIGHWEGDTLVVHTKYIEPKHHYIDQGIPIDENFEITERWKLLDGGKTQQIEFIMTDPTMWKGEWRSTKQWIRKDYSDVPEVEVLPDLNKHLPSTEEGQDAIKEREDSGK
jgi:hypothetical protein